jgi:hypothetical protein
VLDREPTTRSTSSQSRPVPLSNTLRAINYLDPNANPVRSVHHHHLHPSLAIHTATTFRFAPRTPDDLRWRCGIEGCYNNIDVLNLTNKNLLMVDGEAVARTRLQDRSSSDPWVRLAFKTMVEGSTWSPGTSMCRRTIWGTLFKALTFHKSLSDKHRFHTGPHTH